MLHKAADLTITVKDNKPDDHPFYDQTYRHILYPLDLAPKEELILKDFKWNEIRPRPKRHIK